MKITQKRVVFFSLCTLMMVNGCSTKKIGIEATELESKKVVETKKEVSSKRSSQSQNSWGKVIVATAQKDKKECNDCYATSLKEPTKELQKELIEEFTEEEFSEEKFIAVAEVMQTPDNVQYYGVYDYIEEETPMAYMVAQPNAINSAEGSFSLDSKIAIQVGAFKNYGGAKRYKKKYTLLNSNYKVDIKTVQNEYEPLYRVQIEGFNNRLEAKEFMDKYGIRNGFLVKK